MKTKEKFMLVSITLLFAISIPLLILFLFNVIFAEFYTKGFLNGLVHMLICVIMIIINAVSMPAIILKSYKKNIIEDKDGIGGYNFFKTIIISFFVIILIQIILSILIENPF